MNRKFICDLGNSNYKIIPYENEKNKVCGCSNVQKVDAGTYGSITINGEAYLFGENAKSKRTTNKICAEKKALLAHALYNFVDDKEKVDIVALLPLSLYCNPKNRDKYKELLKGKYTINTTSNITKTFTVADVDVCAESFSSLFAHAELLLHPLYLVDIGGVDVTGVFVNKVPNPDQLFTSETGMNIFYSGLAKVLTSETLTTYSDKDAALLYRKYNKLPDELKELIDNFAKQYVKEHIYDELEAIGYKPLIHKLAFVGGGAISLERYLNCDSNIRIVSNAIWSNVEGSRVVSQRRSGGK